MPPHAPSAASIDAAFNDRRVIPLTTLRDVPSNDTLKLYFAWCERLGAPFESSKHPWVPVGQVGPVLVIAHCKIDAHCPFPPWVAQRAVIKDSSYRAFVTFITPLVERFSGGDKIPLLPVRETLDLKHSNNPGELIDLIAQEFILTDQQKSSLASAKAKGHIAVNVIPEGFWEAMQFIRGAAAVVDIRNAAFDLACNSAIQETIRAQFTVAVFYSTERCIYVAAPAVANNQIKDVLGAILGSTHKGCKICLVLASASAIKDTSTNRANRTETDAAMANAKVKALQQGASDHSKSDMILNEDKLRNFEPIPGQDSNEDLFEHILYRGIKQGVSDIHFEQVNGIGRVRFRRDGDLHIFMQFSIEVSRGLLGFVKSGGCGISGLDTNNHMPQDTRASARIGKDVYNLRLNLIPHRLDTHQVLVIRILAKHSDLLSLDKLGLDTRALSIFRRAIGRPHGLILVTGPTGSGKTTTLYACLAEINTTDIKINTIEDPIEIDLEGTTQSQLNESQEVTFAALRAAVLRQDPDVIMMGEIRDTASAELALSLAETGHLVFSTLHTNSEIEAISRMMDMIKDKDRKMVLAKSLLLLQAQRLVPRLCPECRKERPVTPEERAILALHGHQGITEVYTADPKGCPQCSAGLKGRTSVMSLLPVTKEISGLVMKNADVHDLAATAKNLGFLSLYEEALNKVLTGEITMEAADVWRDPWEGFSLSEPESEPEGKRSVA
jgi:type II secretory ATPase GspE/PulE/Tfp pilus assembly ATPase PilB-like protein